MSDSTKCLTTKTQTIKQNLTDEIQQSIVDHLGYFVWASLALSALISSILRGGKLAGGVAKTSRVSSQNFS